MFEKMYYFESCAYKDKNSKFIMFPNSNCFVCETESSQLKPFSSLVQLQMSPFSFYRQTDSSFLFCDSKDHMVTNIMELSYDKEGKISTKVLQQFMGIYEHCSFGDDHAFLMNKEGDIVYYDLCNKNAALLQKQHPSPFHSLQIHNIGESFVTVGGNVQNIQNQDEKIIKLWQFQDGELISKARIVTGHKKTIENSLIMGQNRVISMSTDKTIRSINLAIQQVEQVIRVSFDYYSGCPLDWNAVLLGGLGKSLDIFDIRSKKLISTAKPDIPIIQICEMMRLTENRFLLSNVNHLYSLDIRNFKVEQKGSYEGERITKITALNRDTLVIGNRDKTLQLWTFA